MDTINQLTWYPSYAKALQSLPYILKGEDIPEELVPYPPTGRERLETAGQTLEQLRDPEQAATSFMPGALLKSQAKPIVKDVLKSVWDAWKSGEIKPSDIQSVSDRLQKTFNAVGTAMRTTAVEHPYFAPKELEWMGHFQVDPEYSGRYHSDKPGIEMAVATGSIAEDPRRYLGTLTHEAAHHLTFGGKAPTQTMKWISPLYDDLKSTYSHDQLRRRVYDILDEAYGSRMTGSQKLDLARWASDPYELVATHLSNRALERMGIEPSSVQRLFGELLPPDIRAKHSKILDDLAGILGGEK